MVDEYLKDLWDNEEDERWNDFLIDRHTCARCGKPFERTPLGAKSISISISTINEYILVDVCPKCYLKWKIEFDIEVF